MFKILYLNAALFKHSLSTDYKALLVDLKSKRDSRVFTLQDKYLFVVILNSRDEKWTLPRRRKFVNCHTVRLYINI